MSSSGLTDVPEPRATPTLADVVTRYGAWADNDVLVCGSPAMIRATVSRMLVAGTPLDEAKRLIPTYCPEWTNHNVSDPGVALIELFAWMTDLLLFRLNRVPERAQPDQYRFGVRRSHP